MKLNLPKQLIPCLFFIFFAANKSTAQQEISTAFFDQMSAIFGSLETNRVPHGLLYDIAFEQAQLTNYEGSVLADSNSVNWKEFQAIYQTYRSMRVNNFNIRTINALESQALPYREPGTILLTGLVCKYAKVREDALIENLISQVGNSLRDKYVNGNWQDPYQIKTLFAVSPFVSEFRGLSHNIVLRTSLIEGNSFDPSSFRIDAGDGFGYRQIPSGPINAYEVTYATAGEKTIKMKVTLNTGEVLQSHFKILVTDNAEEPNNEMRTQTISSLPANMAQMQITSPNSFEGQSASGFVTIKYANDNAGLQKPLIVVEGFDPGHITNPESKDGITGIYGFLSDINGDASDLKNILLNLPQYDIIYVDWKKGTDNLKRNAQLLKEVIRRVNAWKTESGSTAKNIIIGQSMGGLEPDGRLRRWKIKGRIIKQTYLSAMILHIRAQMCLSGTSI
ncbi:hypothetical protein [Desertivirga xinjiangensis]|uniref:hypothetical protein n=1 Tax=Desertivirga xinjiangensis TaxID=539206 RepID=UPI00210A4816|nr:hypothetical protein [Pedobacter xinjiangensis]